MSKAAGAKEQRDRMKPESPKTPPRGRFVPGRRCVHFARTDLRFLIAHGFLLACLAQPR
jgi:hypothetical protein